ncbi:hypothetical protein ABIF90_008115 [Bradyrhizobium japonicum]
MLIGAQLATAPAQALDGVGEALAPCVAQW